MKSSKYFLIFILLFFLTACNQMQEKVITIVVPYDGHKEYLEQEVLMEYKETVDESLEFDIVSLYGDKYDDEFWYEFPNDVKEIEKADIIFGFAYNQYDSLIEQDLLYDISTSVKKWEEKTYTPILQAWQRKGIYYGVSPGFYNYALAFNTDQVDIEEIPLTDDFLSTLQQETPYKIALPGLYSYIFAYNFINRPNEEYMFEKSKKGLELVNPHNLAHFLKISQNKNISLDIDEFWHGNVELAILNPKDIDFYIGAKGDFEFLDIPYSFLPLPTLVGSSKKGYGVPGDMLAISKYTKNPIDSLNFLEYILSNYRFTLADSGSMGNFPVYNFKEWNGYEQFKAFYDGKEIPNLDIVPFKMSEYREVSSMIEFEFTKLEQVSHDEFITSITKKLQNFKVRNDQNNKKGAS